MVKIRTCPRCGSRNIELDDTMGISGVKYKCRTCGYVGDIIVEQDIDKNVKK